MCGCVLYTWQRCDEVPLQHGFEVGVDVAVLIVTHAWYQMLHKLHLVGLRPLVKQLDAHVLLFLVVALRRPLSRAWQGAVGDLEEERRGELMKKKQGCVLFRWFDVTLGYITHSSYFSNLRYSLAVCTVQVIKLRDTWSHVLVVRWLKSHDNS